MAVCRFSLEGLEPRRLLSGVPGDILNVTGLIPPSEVVDSPSPAAGILESAAKPGENAAQPETSAAKALITTVPASGAQLTQSPDSLVVTFNQQDNIGSDWWQDGNVQLDQINNDGTTTQLFDPNAAPNASFDSSGTATTIPLDQTLMPGHYQIVLVGGSGVSSFLSGDGVLWDPSKDLILADFTVVPNVPVVPVAPKGTTLDDAVNLGTIGSQIEAWPGSLDLSGGQGSVALYKITLGPGHFWRLGVELDAQRIGSSLLGALTLFDQQGNVLATRDAGTGLPSSPDDPYFFTGLNPGVYYIGVSARGTWRGSQVATIPGPARLARRDRYKEARTISMSLPTPPTVPPRLLAFHCSAPIPSTPRRPG